MKSRLFRRKRKIYFPPISEAALARLEVTKYDILQQNPLLPYSEASSRAIVEMKNYYGPYWWQRFHDNTYDKYEAMKIRQSLQFRILDDLGKIYY